MCDSNKDKQDKISSLECDLCIAENKIEELEYDMKTMKDDLKKIKGIISPSYQEYINDIKQITKK
eukprot:SAG22_NODE_15197_length_354_cov_1.396078_1_plen_64_part_01